MPDGLEGNEETPCLPEWEGLPGVEDATEMDTPQEGPSVDNVLPAPPEPVHGKPRRKKDHRRIKAKLNPGSRSVEQDYREYIRRQNPEKRKAYLKNKSKIHTENAIQDQRYKFSRSWFKRKCGPNQDQLQRWIDGNAELNRLKRVLDTPWAERRNAMAKQIREKLLPPLEAQRQALQAEIEPLLNQLLALNSQMRKVLMEIDFVNFKAHFCSPPRDLHLKQMIQYRIKKMTYKLGEQIWRNEKLRIAEIHGFHGYLKSKYRGYNIVIDKEKIEEIESKRHRRGRRRPGWRPPETETQQATEGEQNHEPTTE